MPDNDPIPQLDEFTPEQVGFIRAQLREILSSNAFKGSKRAQDFLQLVIEHALAGRLDKLRERMIGAEMFGRPVDYDTANDAVVRVKATEVRKKLTQYYQEQHKPLNVRIELPVGSYVPRFQWESAETPNQTPEEGPFSPVAEQSVFQEHLERDIESPPQFRLPLPVFWVSGLVALILIASIGYWRISRRRTASADPPNQEIHSIAILPLANLSSDPKQEYFADGMTEELIADLGQVSALQVISRTSVMTYKGTRKTLPEIARELNVDAVVEGSVAREGKRIRVTAQLIDAQTDRHLWARTYERDLKSVLDLQGEVAQAIADEVRINLTPQEQARLTRPRTVDQEAAESYMQGMHLLNAADPKQAVKYLQSAVDKDPNFAAAHTALATSYAWMGSAGWMPYNEAFSKERAEAIKAIQIDSDLPDGHVQLADAVMNLGWDWTTPGKELQRALELNPNAAGIHWAYAFYLERLGKIPEAVAEAKRAVRLDPVSSRSFSNAAFVYYYAHQYDEALENLQRAQDLIPNPLEIVFPLAVVYVEKGKYEEGIQEFQKLGDAPHALGHMGNAYAREGRIKEAQETVAKLKEHIDKQGIGRYEIAIVYAALGKKDEAFQWLENGYAVHDKGLTYLKIDPCLDPLRSDPRFQNLERRVGLTLQ